MGLMSPDEVAPVKVYNFNEIEGDTLYNDFGPFCHQEPAFIGSRELSIQDIIIFNGTRVPPYAESQKDFRIGFVIIVPSGQTIDSNFIDAVKIIGGLFQQDWAKATGYRSKIIIDAPITATSLFDIKHAGANWASVAASSFAELFNPFRTLFQPSLTFSLPTI